ncbi:hypothetical protein CKO11_06755 [Rhodobacter sp. TJ_12]|uniref:hypothetical protein n=1 Tax=Rhodobacter sp. TJ_12 TaxID=2029399 RepID=UPI001CBE1767|nr:hypothetical protein [Rhodobacter sp. TJ_12]MBZ4022156.1 hypothetical protein [Rhodobacter sp. TJ_12]
MKYKYFLLLVPVLLIAVVELSLRFVGVIDFPLYDVDNVVGYVPRANQSGSFLNRNDWVINDRNMSTATRWEDGEDDLLLVGDSIVWCGNSYRREDRLSFVLQAREAEIAPRRQVWPISAGSWAVVNEVNWLEANRDVLAAAEHVVFVFNSADFGVPSSWRSSLTHPRQRPWSALAYVVQKYLLSQEAPPTPAELIVPPRDPVKALTEITEGCDCNLHIWLYPTKAEFLDPQGKGQALEGGFAPFLAALGDEVTVHRVADIPEWSVDSYKDGIHGSPQGLRILADAIAEGLQD